MKRLTEIYDVLECSFPNDVLECSFPNCDCDLSNNGHHRCPKQEKFK